MHVEFVMKTNQNIAHKQSMNYCLKLITRNMAIERNVRIIFLAFIGSKSRKWWALHKYENNKGSKMSAGLRKWVMFKVYNSLLLMALKGNHSSHAMHLLHEECRLLECHAMLLLYESTDRRNVSPPSSGCQTSVLRRATRRHIPEDRITRSHCVKISNLIFADYVKFSFYIRRITFNFHWNLDPVRSMKRTDRCALLEYNT
jgi:hypothetical protein